MEPLDTPLIPVSWGELLDKLTILAIKCDRLTAASALANVARERSIIERLAAMALRDPRIEALTASLTLVNDELWVVEDDLRRKEDQGDFGDSFVALARSVYQKNDERASIKRRINDLLQSEIVEEKSYWNAAGPQPRRPT